MKLYPTFTVALATIDVDQLAERSGVCAETIRAVAQGDDVPSLSVMMRLGVALDRDPRELFAVDPAVERLLATAPTRYAADLSALRQIERALSP